jgi:hypothetical protein
MIGINVVVSAMKSSRLGKFDMAVGKDYILPVAAVGIAVKVKLGPEIGRCGMITEDRNM